MKKLIQKITMSLIVAALLFTSCETDLVGDLETNPTTISVTKSRDCGSQSHMYELMSRPGYAAKRIEMIIRFNKLNNQAALKAQCGNPVQIPVAVHYQGVNSSNESCLIDLARRQIDVLNEDFGGTNSDISKWNDIASSTFSGVNNGEACLSFVLANQSHPSGYGLSNGNPAVTINKTQGDQLNAWAGYLNIYVQFDTGVLGYAPLGGFGNGDGVVIDAEAFGAGNGCGAISPGAPYNLGRTTTHEVGHYLLLEHIWGNGCGVDDEVADTPSQASDNAGCPAIGISSCGSADMHMNYMDYTNDACMYMFSAGQASRMENYVASSLTNLTNNVAHVFDGATNGGGDNGGGDTGGDDNGGGDDNEGENPATCGSPTSAAVTETGNAKALVDWADIAGATKYRIRYKIIGTSGWTTKGGRNSKKTLFNLVQGETYKYQLRAKCPTGWTAWSGNQTFTFGSPPDNGGDDTGGGSTSSSYILEVTLDEYGSETTWYIVNANQNDVASGGPYQDFKSGSKKTTTMTLVNGCYDLEIYDAYGDGICCDYGDGKVRLINSQNQEVASSNGRFGSFDIVSFCIDNDGARITDRKSDKKRANRGGKKK